MRIVVVTGGRYYLDAERVGVELAARSPDLVIQGGCPTGADELARDWAERNVKAHPVSFHAKWGLHGRSAGPKRNAEMMLLAAELANAGCRVEVVAFPGGAGTANAVRCARHYGLTVKEIES